MAEGKKSLMLILIFNVL